MDGMFYLKCVSHVYMLCDYQNNDNELISTTYGTKEIKATENYGNGYLFLPVYLELPFICRVHIY